MAQNGQPTTTGTATSRLNQGRRAVRRKARARLALSGVAGSGKTWTALDAATELAEGGPILLHDTELESAELYADHFVFDTIQWEPPYDPRDLAITVTEAGHKLTGDTHWTGHDGGYAVQIIDSGSHFWVGEGGTLDVADSRFGGWKTATPAQDKLVSSILQSPSHVILCLRAKTAYAVEEMMENGVKKQKVTRLGLQSVQRDTFEYEMNVVAYIDPDHRIEIGKTRCPTLAGKMFRPGEQLQLARNYAEWLRGGEALAPESEVEHVRELLRRGTRDQQDAFVAQFGKTAHLVESVMPAVMSWLAETLMPADDGQPEEGPSVNGNHPDSVNGEHPDQLPVGN